MRFTAIQAADLHAPRCKHSAPGHVPVIHATLCGGIVE